MDRYQKHFYERLEYLISFYKKEGRWPSEISIDDTERSLGVWCHKIRHAYSKGTLEEYKLKALSIPGFPLGSKKDDWAEKFEQLKNYVEEHEDLPGTGHELYSFVRNNRRRFDELPVDKKDRLRSIRFQELVHNQNDGEETWNKNFEKLVIFFQTYSKLPTRKTDYFLEGWLSRQRQLKKKGLLEEEKERLFNRAGIDLLQGSFERGDDRWESRFEELQAFVKLHNRLPRAAKDKETRLFKWLTTQKRLLEEKKLPPKKRKKLNLLFGEDMTSVFPDLEREKFEMEFKKLKQFLKIEKRWPAKKAGTTAEERKLAAWCGAMRNQFRNNSLSSYAIDALQKTGFAFDLNKEKQAIKWEKLKACLQSSGGLIRKGHPLYSFYLEMMDAYDRLSKEKKELLDGVIVRENKPGQRYIFNWEERFEEVLNFVQKNKRLPSQKKNRQLLSWWAAIRDKIRKGNFPEEKIKMLEEAGVVIRLEAGRKWEQNFNELRDFVEKKRRWPGTLNDDEKRLRTWCYQQLYRRRDNKLSAEQLEKLNSIHFFSLEKKRETIRSSSPDNVWEHNFKKLRDFFQTHGRLPAKETDKILANWINSQRRLLKKGLLEKEKAEMFEAAGIHLFKESSEKKEGPWEKSLNELKTFIETNRRPPNQERSERTLYRWFRDQKQLLYDNKLAAWKVEKLQEILRIDLGPDFRFHFAESFEKVFEKLKQFVEEHHRWPRKYGTGPYERKLADWCFKKRSAFHTDTLPEDQADMLRSINFPFDLQQKEAKTKFEELKSHVEKSVGVLLRSHRFYRFYLEQKQAYETLDQDKKSLIDSIVISDEKRSLNKTGDWDKVFDQLVAFIQKHKRLPYHNENKELYYRWTTIRKKIREGRFAQEKIEALEQLGIVTMDTNTRWEEMFKQVKAFVRKNERWPGTTEPYEIELNRWCIKQRLRNKRGKLEKERIEKLNAIQFAWVGKTGVSVKSVTN